MSKALQRIASVLSEEKRLQILNLLMDEALTADEIKEKLKISRTGTEKHLAILMEVGFIERRAYRSNRLKYVYFTTNSVEVLLDTMKIACENYVSMREEELHEQLRNLKRAMEMGFLSKEEVMREEERIIGILNSLSNDSEE